MTWLKRFLLAAFLLAAIGGMVFLFRPEPVLVDAAPVERGPMRVTIGEEGKTRIRDVYAVSAPVSGRAARSALKVGDRVEEGQTIASIHPADPPFIDLRTRLELEAAVAAAKAAVGHAEAELSRVQAALRVTENDVERARRLSESGTISPRALEGAILDLDTARAQTREAEASLELRRNELRSAEARLLQPGSSASAQAAGSCCVNVPSPVGGVVLSLPVESEQIVQSGTLLAEIGQTSDLEIVVDLLSRDVVGIAPGDAAIVSDWGGEPLAARVRRIDPAAFTKVSALGIEEQRVNTILDLTSQPEPRRSLGHGFRVYVELVTWEADGVLMVPVGSLFRAGDDWAVFVLEEGRARQAIVGIGHRNDSHAEVLSGLEAGDRVILHPSDRIEEGVRVSVR